MGGGVALIRLEEEELGEEGDEAGGAEAVLIEVAGEAIELLGGGFGAGEAEAAAEVIGDGEEAGVLEALGAAPFDDVRFSIGGRERIAPERGWDLHPAGKPRGQLLGVADQARRDLQARLWRVHPDLG